MIRSFNWNKYFVVVAFFSKATGSLSSSVSPSNGEDLFQLALALKKELSYGIREAAYRKYAKEELLQSFRRILQPYALLRAPPFRVAINNYISMETGTWCSIHLDDEEMSLLWRAVQ